MGQKIQAIANLFKNKILWKRILITMAVIGAISAVVLMDHSCDMKNLTCDSKSKINIDVKRGQ